MQIVYAGVSLSKAYAQAAAITRIEDGKIAIFLREATYNARMRISGQYVWRSLKTGNLAVAIKAATKLFHTLEAHV